MNKKFLSAILFGALMVTSTGTFVSCKDYDDDIDNINKELTDIKSQIAALQTKVNEGKWITSLTSTTGGFTITFSDKTSYTIVNGKDGAQGPAGAAGKDGTTVEVKDGFWYIGGEKTDYVAVTKGELGKVNVPYVNTEDGYWYFYNEKGEAVKSAYKAIGATYVVNANGVYTLYVPDANGVIQTIKLPTAGSTLSDVEFLGYAKIAKMDQAVSVGTDIGGDLEVAYKWVEKIVKVYDGNKEATWSAQKTVTKGQVLTTLSPLNLNLMTRIVAGADAADMSFTLKNSKGATLPITLAPAKAYTGLLSRSASGLYAISMDNDDATYASAAKYAEKFSTGLYALVEKSGFTSNYMLEVSAADATVVEGKVEKVDDKAIVSTSYYEVALNKANAISFTNPEFVYDYYVEAEDPTIAGLFGFTADKANGTFTVTKLADQITTATFGVNVYKLHIDGKIYKETILIKPVRSLGTEVVYNLGNYTIKSNGKMTVDLANMFTALGTEDAAIWKNATLGAKATAVTIVKDEDESETDLAATGGKLNATTFTYKKADGSATTSINTATKFEIAPNYKVGTEASFEIGKGYTITITYKDANDKPLNSIKVKFTPVIPALSSYIAKKDAVWNGNVLMAYFDNPASNVAENDADVASSYVINNGFTKLGSTEAADKTVITLSLNKDQKVEGDNKLGEGAAAMAAIAVGTDAAAKSTITLNKTTINSKENQYAYAKELEVAIDAKYLEVYGWSKEDKAAAAFKIKVQSALIAGTINPAQGASITMPAAAAGEVSKLTASMITGYTYNKQPYSLFKSVAASGAAANFKYTYIKKVEFTSVDETLYKIKAVVAPTWGEKAEVASYVAIESGNISKTTTTEIKVKVTDAFGYTKEVKVPLTITVAE